MKNEEVVVTAQRTIKSCFKIITVRHWMCRIRVSQNQGVTRRMGASHIQSVMNCGVGISHSREVVTGGIAGPDNGKLNRGLGSFRPMETDLQSGGLSLPSGDAAAVGHSMRRSGQRWSVPWAVWLYNLRNMYNQELD